MDPRETRVSVSLETLLPNLFFHNSMMNSCVKRQAKAAPFDNSPGLEQHNGGSLVVQMSNGRHPCPSRVKHATSTWTYTPPRRVFEPATESP